MSFLLPSPSGSSCRSVGPVRQTFAAEAVTSLCPLIIVSGRPLPPNWTLSPPGLLALGCHFSLPPRGVPGRPMQKTSQKARKSLRAPLLLPGQATDHCTGNQTQSLDNTRPTSQTLVQHCPKYWNPASCLQGDAEQATTKWPGGL